MKIYEEFKNPNNENSIAESRSNAAGSIYWTTTNWLTRTADTPRHKKHHFSNWKNWTKMVYATTGRVDHEISKMRKFSVPWNSENNKIRAMEKFWGSFEIIWTQFLYTKTTFLNYAVISSRSWCFQDRLDEGVRPLSQSAVDHGALVWAHFLNGTTSTGRPACLTTYSLTLPSTAFLKAPSPRHAITTQSAPSCSATAQIAWPVCWLDSPRTL